LVICPSGKKIQAEDRYIEEQIGTLDNAVAHNMDFTPNRSPRWTRRQLLLRRDMSGVGCKPEVTGTPK
jgi:hypothetical protein